MDYGIEGLKQIIARADCRAASPRSSAEAYIFYILRSFDKNLLLVGDELELAVLYLHRAALQLDHCDGNAVH